MKKKFLSLQVSVFLLICAIVPPSVSAHILQADGNIGAVLHIDPQDDPVAGQQSAFFFEFKDKTGKFSSWACNCTFAILQGGKELVIQPLFPASSDASADTASVFFTFPKRDVYQIRVNGTPVTPNTFQPFTLTYDVRVAREKTGSTTDEKKPFPPVAAVLIGLALFFIVILLIKSLRKKSLTHVTMVIFAVFLFLTYGFPFHYLIPHDHQSHQEQVKQHCCLSPLIRVPQLFVFMPSLQFVFPFPLPSSKPVFEETADRLRIRSPPYPA